MNERKRQDSNSQLTFVRCHVIKPEKPKLLKVLKPNELTLFHTNNYDNNLICTTWAIDKGYDKFDKKHIKLLSSTHFII